MTEKRKKAVDVWGKDILHDDPALELRIGRWYVDENGDIVRLIAQDYKVNPTLFMGIREDTRLGVALSTLYRKNGCALGKEAFLLRELVTASPRQSSFVSEFLRSKSFQNMLRLMFKDKDSADHYTKHWTWSTCAVSPKGRIVKPTYELFAGEENDR